MHVVITSMRNEASYILEWVAWNIYIGFNKVVVFTNDNTDETLSILEGLKAFGVVDFQELFPGPDEKPQMVAFAAGAKWVNENRPESVCCIDPDEFLLLKKDKNISQYLRRFPDADAIAINWKIFGSGGLKYKGRGFTCERFLMASNANLNENRQFKTIFRCRKSVKRFHHRVFFDGVSQQEVRYIYSNGVELSGAAQKPGFDLKSNRFVNYDFAQINHYAIRSEEELRAKMARGNGLEVVGENPRFESYRKKFDTNKVYETEILEHLPGYRKIYDELYGFLVNFKPELASTLN